MYRRVFGIERLLATILELCAALLRSRPTVRAVSLLAIGALIPDRPRSASVARGARDVDFSERPVVFLGGRNSVGLFVGYLWWFQWLVQ